MNQFAKDFHGKSGSPLSFSEILYLDDDGQDDDPNDVDMNLLGLDGSGFEIYGQPGAAGTRKKKRKDRRRSKKVMILKNIVYTDA